MAAAMHRWLKAAHVYTLTVLDIRSLKWVGRVVLLLEALGEGWVACLFQFLEVARIPWFVALHLSL